MLLEAIGLLWRLITTIFLLREKTIIPNKIFLNHKKKTLLLIIISTLNLIICIFSKNVFLILEITLIIILTNYLRITRLARIIIEATDKNIHYLIEIGAFYVAVWIRGYIIFGFLGIKGFKIFVAPKNAYKESKISIPRRVLGKYYTGKIEKIEHYEDQTLLIVRGKMIFRDPKRKVWYEIKGKYAIIVF